MFYKSFISTPIHLPSRCAHHFTIGIRVSSTLGLAIGSWFVMDRKELDDVQTYSFIYDNNDKRELHDVWIYSFSHDDLLKMCENLSNLFNNLKKNHLKIKKESTSLKKSFKTTLIELNKVKKSYENLENKKSKIKMIHLRN